jgi:hypothetical protein
MDRAAAISARKRRRNLPGATNKLPDQSRQEKPKMPEFSVEIHAKRAVPIDELQRAGNYFLVEEAVHKVQPGACWSVGPLDICFTLDVPNESVSVTISFLNQRIATATLNAAHTSFSTGVSLAVWKFNVTVTADFHQKHLTAAGTVSQYVCTTPTWQHPIPSCGWEDRKFNQTIFSW